MMDTPLFESKRQKIQRPSPVKPDLYQNDNEIEEREINGFLGFLKRTEKYAHIKLELKDQQFVTKGMRAILVDWMSELCYNYSLHRVTFHIAVSILDRYLSQVYTTKRSEFQTLGAVCVLLATKLCVKSSVLVLFIGAGVD